MLITISVSLFFISQNSFSQTCNQIVGGTHFDALPGHETDYYYDFNLVKQIGPSGNILSSAASFADAVDDFKQSKFVYSMTSNPKKLNDQYMDVEDTMLVVKMQTGTNSPLFSYKVSGLQAGSNYTVTFKVYHLPTLQSDCFKNNNQWINSEIKIGVNPDVNGNGMSIRQFGSQAAGWGQSYDYTLSGTLAAGVTSVDLQIWTGYNFNSCSAIGIGNVKVLGCLDPKIKSSQGTEVCTGEQTLLTLDKDYFATTYSWEKSTNGGVDWTTVGSNKSLVDKVDVASVYRVSLDGTNSKEFEVTTITCCQNEVGAPSSRTTVFFDDFGRFPTANSYEDAFGRVTTGLSRAYRANVNYTMPGHTFDGTGDVGDGSYAVAAYMPINVATWFNAIQEDHSQEKNGGQLFINVAYNFVGVVYDREITGLCNGKELYFEAYIANASGQSNPIIKLNITSPDGNTILGTATATAFAGQGWQRVSVPPFVLNGYTSVRIQIDSRGGEGTSDDSYWRDGNDLLIDDIKFMVCSPPTLDFVANPQTMSQTATVCSDALDLTIFPSSLLEQYYGNNPKYLIQYSIDPDVLSSWHNIDIPSNATNLAIPDTKISQYFSTVPNHGKIYFRAIAATQAIFDSKNNFSAPNYAEKYNYCKNYTISNEVVITMECPVVACTLPTSVVLTSSDVDKTLCPGETATITSNNQSNPTSFDFTWYKGSVTPANIVKATSSGISSDSYDISFAEAGSYILQVRDKFMPTDPSCYKIGAVEIKKGALPTYTISGGGASCEGVTPSNVIVNFISGTAPYSITWTDPSTTVSNILTPFYMIPSTAEGTYSLTAISDKNCSGSITSESASISYSGIPQPDFFYSSDDTVYFENEGVARQTDSIYRKMNVDFTNTTFATIPVDESLIFSWDFNHDSIIDDVSFNSTHQFLDTGTVLVTLYVENTSGCKNSITKPIFIDVNPNCKMKFPNAITPDLAKDNQFYPVYANGISKDGYELRIYDRWGAQMWSTTNLDQRWDGTFKGKVCKQDVYVYHCKAQCEQKDAKGNKKEFNVKGDVTVIR